MRNKIPFLMMIIISVLLVIVGCSSGSEEETTKIKLGHTLTEDSAWQKGAEHFAETIKEETDGLYEVDIFPNGQLASNDQKKALEMLRQGSYDIDITSALIWSDFDDELGITALPWIVPDHEDVEEVTNGEAGKMLLDILDNNGVKAVDIGETGYRQMYNNEHQIKSPDDLKNLKMRVPGTPVFIDLFEEIGADPTSMDFTEVFTGLQQGTIDGVEGVSDVVLTNRFQEVLEYMSINNYNFDFFFLTFSEDIYDSLSEEDQEIFMEAGKEATDYITEYSQEIDEESIEEISESLDVYELSDDEIEEFRDYVSPIYDKYKDTYSEEL